MSAPTDLPDALPTVGQGDAVGERADTGGMTALADAVRERRGTGPQPAPGVTMATLPAARMEEISGALHGAADLVSDWRAEAAQMRAEAPWGPRGIRQRLWADALEAAADDLRMVVEPARRVRRPRADGAPVPAPRAPAGRPAAQVAVTEAVAAVVAEHAELTVPQRLARASWFPFDVAQAVINVVAPAAYARGVAAARALLIDLGDLDAAAALDELEQR